MNHSPLNLKVYVFETEGDDKPIREYTMDYNGPGKRNWLQKIMMWALLNNKSVEIINTIDDK